MDQVTHLVSGIIQGNYFRHSLKIKLVFWACVLGALIPDIDIIAYLADKTEYIIHHRRLSHGIITSFFWALLLCLIFWGRSFASFKQKRPVFFATLFTVLFHIYLDLFTSYGTSILSPFDNHRFSLDALFIVDPIYIGILLVSYFALKAFKCNPKRTYLSLISILLLYPLFSLGIKTHVEYHLRENNKESTLYVLPDFLSPLRWKVIRLAQDKVILQDLNIFTQRNSSEKIFIPIDMELIRKTYMGDKFLRFYFEEFLRFPVMMREGDLIKILDLRFYPAGELWSSLRGRDVPFTLVLNLVDGDLIWYELGKKRYFTK